MTQSIPVDEIGDNVRRDRNGRYLIVPPEGGKPIGYTRVTTVAKTLDSGGALGPWKAAMASTGLMMRPGLRAQWEALLARYGDPWYATPESKAEAKRLVEEACAVGGANDRKEMGSALHTISAMVDKGVTPTHLTAETEVELNAYRTGLALASVDIDAAYIECCVVLDHWRVAGTFDRIVTVPGFDLPLIADLKTGADLSYSWQSIAVQLAAYAHGDNLYEQGKTKDGSADTRAPMPEVDQHWALVMWLPAGDADLQLFIVDIALGWQAFEKAMWTRSWRARKDVSLPLNEFTYDLPMHLPALGVGGVSHDTAVDALTEQLEASVVEVRGPVRTWLQDRIEVIGAHPTGRDALAHGWPASIPTLRSSTEHTVEQLAVIEHLLDAVEREHNVTFPPARPDNVTDLFPT